MCFVIALLSFLWVSFIVRPSRRSRRGAREHLSCQCGELPFRGLRRGPELSAKILRERVREDVLLPGLDAVEDRERHVTRRGLRQRQLAAHAVVNGARVDAEDRDALRPEEGT